MNFGYFSIVNHVTPEAWSLLSYFKSPTCTFPFQSSPGQSKEKKHILEWTVIKTLVVQLYNYIHLQILRILLKFFLQ